MQRKSKKMLNVFRTHRSTTSIRKLHVGVMMSHKTLHGIPSKWTKVFPAKETVEAIFLDDPLLYNVAHFADYGKTNAVEILSDLELITRISGAHLHAIQLDMLWPDEDAIIAYRRRHPRIEIILQVSGQSLEVVGENPTNLIARLSKYGDSIDYVLLDKSVGKGLGMDAHTLLPFARAIRSGPYSNKLRAEKGDFKLVAAGGLGPDSLHLVEPLVTEFPDISIDAQGRLRPSGNSMDPIDWNMAETYLIRALQLLK